MAAIEAAVVEVPTRHRLLLGDARCASPARRVGPARGHLTAQHAVDHLYRVAVTENKATSTARLDTLAEFCIQELTQRGLLGIEKEASIPGAGPDRHPDRANRSQRPECGQPSVVRRRFGRSNTEITLNKGLETDAAVRAVIRQRIESVEQIEPIFPRLQGFEIRGQDHCCYGLAVLLQRDSFSGALNATGDLGEPLADFGDGQRFLVTGSRCGGGGWGAGLAGSGPLRGGLSVPGLRRRRWRRAGAGVRWRGSRAGRAPVGRRAG